MGRLFELLILIGLAAIVWRLVRNALFGPDGGSPPNPAAGSAPKYEPMGRCAKCGTHVPSTQLNAAGLCPRCA